jgi:hypothetical protein
MKRERLVIGAGLFVLATFFVSPQSCALGFRRAPATFILEWNTTVRLPNPDGSFRSVIRFNISRNFAPNGVDRLYQLLTLPEGSYYNNNAFYRVLPDYFVQFGINGGKIQ